MGIPFLLGGGGVLLAGGIFALLVSRWRGWSNRIGPLGAVIGSLLALPGPLAVLFGEETASIRAVWQVPYGSFHLEIDPLTAWFLAPILGMSALAAMYGRGYLSGAAPGRSSGAHWFFFNLLVVSMMGVVTARNGVLFLVAWEGMSLASYFLVVHEVDDERVRAAGWMYWVASHLGAACLLAMFAWLGRGSGTLDFSALAQSGRSAQAAGAAFLLGLVGFGTKAGLVPFHVWLPEAHPAAPSHVSALMSAVMIKTGVYGILRLLMLLGAPPAWWGWVLVGVGGVSGVGGILLALGQRDLKRMLAYSSVENVGIILLGVGLGVLGRSIGSAVLATLGMAGALLHVLNHALMKGMLFFCAGAILHATGIRDLDRLGGLSRRFPLVGASFLIGAAAISGLPPLNAFAGEFLIFLCAFGAVANGALSAAVPAGAAMAGLALMSGLAAACFTQAYGTLFLGTPRESDASTGHAPSAGMKLPLAILAAACVLAGLAAPGLVKLAGPAVVGAAGLTGESADACLAAAIGPLRSVVFCAALLLLLSAGVAALRARLLAGRTVTAGPTWDCGYAAPTRRMQYGASSFTQPLTQLFRPVLRTLVHVKAPRGSFPEPGSVATATSDIAREWGYAPLFRGIAFTLSRLRWLQHGSLHLYLLYLAVTLLLLLLWKLG